MTMVPVSQYVPLRMQPQWKTRNGQIPDAFYQRDLAALANQIRRWRVKEVARFSGNTAQSVGGGSLIVPSGGTRTRWRFAGHCSPQTSLMYARVLCAMPTVTGDAFAQCDINTPGGSLLATGQFHYANVNGSVNDANPSTYAQGTIWLVGANLANNDFRGVFTDNANSRLISASVYEIGPFPDTVSGYIGQTFSVSGAIYDTHRSDVASLGNSIWRNGAASVFHWNTNLDANAITNATATHLNVIDVTSVAPSAATPGWTLDMRYKTTQMQASAGVPCVLAVFAMRSGGSTANSQFVEIVDSTGAQIAVVGNFGTTAGWNTVAFNLPATLAKYDMRFWSTSGTATVYAASVYEYQ